MEKVLYICFQSPFFFFKMKLRSSSSDKGRRITRSLARIQEKGKSIVQKPIKTKKKRKTPKSTIHIAPDSNSSTSQNFPNSSNPLDFFATTVLDFEGITYKKNPSTPNKEISQDRIFCEKTLIAEIILQMDEDTIKYQGVQTNKPLGPDLNLPTYEGEASDETTGTDRTSVEAVAGGFYLNRATVEITGVPTAANLSSNDDVAVDFIPVSVGGT